MRAYVQHSNARRCRTVRLEAIKTSNGDAWHGRQWASGMRNEERCGGECRARKRAARRLRRGSVRVASFGTSLFVNRDLDRGNDVLERGTDAGAQGSRREYFGAQLRNAFGRESSFARYTLDPFIGRVGRVAVIGWYDGVGECCYCVAHGRCFLAILDG